MPTEYPLVAIPTYHLAAGRVLGWLRGGYAVPEGYVAALDRAGACPVLLPPGTGPTAHDVLAHFDGLLLAGGGDVEPARYGAAAHPEVYGVDPVRDQAELDLVGAAIDLGIPTLAICRGLQVLNVALGGTLYQHLPELDGMDLHGHPREDASVLHDVKVAGGTRLAEACGREVVRGTSHHHQAIDRPGDGLTVVALSGDGVIEGVELSHPDAPWLVGVQWHPEITASQDPVQQALFDALVVQARADHS